MLNFVGGRSREELGVAGLIPHGGVPVEVAYPYVFGRRGVGGSLLGFSCEKEAVECGEVARVVLVIIYVEYAAYTHSPVIWMAVMSGQSTGSAVQLLVEMLALTRMMDLVHSGLLIWLRG